MLRFSTLWLVVSAFSTPFALAEKASPLLAPGTRWMLIGDSITHDGRYQEFLMLFLATRFPDRAITILNAGISGDSSSGALRRYDWDIAPRRPTAATIMLGMNDVGRQNYNAEETPERLQKREESLEGFRFNLTQLVTRLQKEGVQVTLITPTPYDDTATLPGENLPGCNQGLARIAQIVKEIAATHSVPVIDVHTPFTELNHRFQANDPAATLIGADRVHPGPNGHLILTSLLLHGLSIPPVVSEVVIDAAKRTATTARNAEVGTPTRADKGIEFTVRAQSLPFPLNAETAQAAELTEFSDLFNQETLRVTGLPPGVYTLTINEEEVGSFDAKTLGEGLRLDKQTNTPQYRQALKVADLVKRCGERVRRGERAIAQVEHGTLAGRPRPIEFEQVREIIEQKLAEEKDPKSYSAFVLRRYLEEKPLETETNKQVENYRAQIVAAAQPQVLRYKLTWTGAGN